jgi:predicted transcriptional regulator YheO
MKTNRPAAPRRAGDEESGETPMHPNLEAVAQVIPCLRQMLGPRYEVILHDLSHVERSIVMLEGDVTHRKVGGPATNYLLKLLREGGDGAGNSVNYRTVLPDGRVLRSSTIFIRDEAGKIVGSLCLNQDLTDYIVARNVLEESTCFGAPEAEPPKETFAQDISEVMESVVDTEVSLIQKPVAYMQKEDKLGIVARLEQKGIFAIKNAVEYVADCLGVSNFTVYNYLKEVRGKGKGSGTSC